MPFQKYLTAKNIAFILLIMVFLFFLAQIKVIAMMFFASFVIACSLNPLVDKLEKKMKRSVAVTIVLTSSIFSLFIFFVPIVFIAAKQVQSLLEILPEKIDSIQNFLYHYSFYGHKIPEIINLDSVINSSSPVATGILNQSINFTIAFAQSVVVFLAICMIVFYFLDDKGYIKESLIKIFPINMKEKAGSVYDNISHKVGGYVIAQILNMVAIGIITTIGLLLIKVDYALVLGIITGVLDIIPIIGPTLALILCLLMVYQKGWFAIALVIVIFLTAQWISNNLVRPIIFGKFLDLHPLIIIFALLVSAQFLGVWGVILAPAIASLVCVLFDEIYLKTINKSE